MFLNQKTLKNGISVILDFTLIFLLGINHINVLPGETLQEIFLGGKNLVIYLVKAT